MPPPLSGPRGRTARPSKPPRNTQATPDRYRGSPGVASNSCLLQLFLPPASAFPPIAILSFRRYNAKWRPMSGVEHKAKKRVRIDKNKMAKPRPSACNASGDKGTTRAASQECRPAARPVPARLLSLPLYQGGQSRGCHRASRVTIPAPTLPGGPPCTWRR